MAEENIQRQADILNFLVSRGFRGCPVCGQVLDPNADEIPFGVGREYALFTAEEETEAYGFVPVGCVNCGHTMWFNTSYLPPQGE